MKVLYVSTKGGIHDYRFLEKLVNDYEVLFLHYSGSPMISEIKQIPNLKIISKKPLIGASPLLSHYFHFKKVVRNFKPDIVHSGYVWQVGILPSLINYHPHLSMPWGSDVLTEPDESFIKRKIVNKVLRQCDHIQCDALFVKNKIIKDSGVKPDKVTVFPWGINLGLFKPLNKNECRKNLGIDEKDFVIIFTRPLEKVYDIKTMLRGFKLFADNKTDVKLLINTDGSQRKILQDLINSELPETKVQFNGWTKYSELPVYFNASDVYLSTSLSDGTSLALLEAMATSLGIIVTDLPANKEWIENGYNGYIIPPGNPEEASNALNKYYTEKTLIKLHGEINHAIAEERADWDKNYEKLKKIYNLISN